MDPDPTNPRRLVALNYDVTAYPKPPNKRRRRIAKLVDFSTLSVSDEMDEQASVTARPGDNHWAIA